MQITEIMDIIGLRDRKSFRAKYLNPALDKGFIEMMYPDNLRHPRQKYRLTAIGLNYKGHLNAQK